MMNSRALMIIGLVVAGVCLVRVFSVAAATSDQEKVEVYSGTEDHADSRSSVDDDASEIRLSRPEEAESRVAHDDGYDMVPGVQRLREREVAENALIVPRKSGRGIASEGAAPASAVSASPSQGRLSSSDVMEPQALAETDARARAAEASSDTIVASSRPLGQPALGLHAEPQPQTSIETPATASAIGSRAGVQEISLIVSDYGYFPNRIFVTENVPVKIYLTTPSKVTMCFMLDTWGVKKGVIPGKVEEISFVPTSRGNFRFYCPVKSIEGTLTVREAPIAEPSVRGLASEPVAAAPVYSNEPKRAAQLRALIDE